jgi:hypothetical protein
MKRSSGFRSLVAVDWGKELPKRRAWSADRARRTVRPLEVGRATLANVIAAARALPGPVLLGLDAALGVPRAYFDAARLAVPEWSKAADFLSWIALAVPTPGFLDEVRAADEWSFARPFISVPRGEGALRRFWARAGGALLRAVDTATGAKSPFVVSGIPGTTGSGTRALWTELLPLLREERDLGVWPFQGSLASIRARKRICLAEIYPRVCYGLALESVLPARLRLIAKVQASARSLALTQLLAVSWFQESGVTVAPDDLETARAHEDDFDAFISTVALLRCVLTGHPLDRRGSFSVEGDILGVGLIDATRRGSRGSCR